MVTTQVVKAVPAHYRLHVGDRRAILVAASTRHADAFAAGLGALGIASKAISANLQPQRPNAKPPSAAWSPAPCGSCAAATSPARGWDVPDLAAVIVLRPTKSLAPYLQQVGRRLRPAPGMQELIVLDHAGNSLVHRLPNAPRHSNRWSTASPPGGALTEVNSTVAARQQAMASRPVSELIHEARTIDDLAAIKRARCFKSGWVWQQWHAIERRRRLGASAS